MRRKSTQQTRIEYKLARNEYVRVRREEEIKYEKSIVDNCKKDFKLFYRYINLKLGHKAQL